jgi:hypothetical protein
MAGITGQGTTFNLPNYVGELFALTPSDTPFLSAIGGLTGGRPVDGSTLFEWQTYDLRDADESRQRVEGANAPTAEERVRGTAHNVVEIHQESVEVTYTKSAATNQHLSNGSNNPNSVATNATNPVGDEMNWQVARALEQIGRDVERTFIVGQFQNPSSNATPRKTRGIMAATATNVSDVVGALKGTATVAADGTFTIASHAMTNGTAVQVRALTGATVGGVFVDTLYYVVATATNTFKLARRPGGAAVTFSSTGGADVYLATQLTEAHVLDLLQSVWDNGGIRTQETATLMTNSTLKRRLTDIFVTGKNYQEVSRNVGGVSLQTFETDFGVLNIMLNRYMPSGALQVVSLEQCAPRFLAIPGKGFLFEEPLAKTGAADKTQIYGEIGLEYGNELAHGKILGVSR